MPATVGQLRILHRAVAMALHQRIKAGHTTYQDLAVAMAFLKHNGVIVEPTAGTATHRLLKAVQRHWPRRWESN